MLLQYWYYSQWEEVRPPGPKRPDAARAQRTRRLGHFTIIRQIYIKQQINFKVSPGKKKFFSKQHARGILSLHLYQITDVFSGKITSGTSLDQKKCKQPDLPLEPQHNGRNSVDST